MNDPCLLISHEFPTEMKGNPRDLEMILRDQLPEANIVRATDYADTMEKISNANIIVEHGLYEDYLNEASSLKWVQSLSSGTNRYDYDRLREINVILTTISGAHARPIAEQVLTYLLAFERGLLQGLRQQQHREWRRYPANELGTRILGIIGIGEIGGRVAELASALEMTVLGVRNHPERPHSAVDKMVGPDELHTVLGRADYIVLACPLTEKTRGMIGTMELSSLGDESVLVNVARGEIVDECALIVALQTGNLRGAALDVFETEPLPTQSPLWELSNVIITPHMAGGTSQFTKRCAYIVAENYKQFVAGEYSKMQNRVL